MTRTRFTLAPRLILLWLSAVLCGCSCGSSVSGDGPAAGLEVLLCVDRPAFEVNQPVTFSAFLVNRGSNAHFVALPLGQGFARSAVPFVDIELRGPDGEAIRPAARSEELLEPSQNDVDGVDLGPGSSLALFGSRPVRIVWFDLWRPSAPGMYSMRLLYDTSVPNPDWSGRVGGEEWPIVREVRARAVRCRLVSDWRTFDVLPSSEHEK